VNAAVAAAEAAETAAAAAVAAALNLQRTIEQQQQQPQPQPLPQPVAVAVGAPAPVPPQTPESGVPSPSSSTFAVPGCKFYTNLHIVTLSVTFKCIYTDENLLHFFLKFYCS
jgi:hypothetical protein